MKNYAGGGKLVFKSLVSTLFLGGILSVASLAEPIDLNEGESYKEDIRIEDSESFRNAGTIQNNNIIVNGSSFSNTGTIDTSILDIKTNNGVSITLSGNISAKESITYRGNNSNNFYQALNADLNTPLLKIIGPNKYKDNQTGLKISNQKSIENVKDFYIESNGGKTGLVISGDINIDGSVTLINKKSTQDARIEVDSGSINIATLNAKDGGDVMLQTNNSSSIQVGNLIAEKDSRLLIQTYSPDYENNQGTIELGYINLNDGAKIQAGAIGGRDGKPNSQSTPILIKGKIVVDLGKDAGLDFGGYDISYDREWRPEGIIFDADSLTVNVKNSRSDSYVYLSGYEDENGKNLKTAVNQIKLIAEGNDINNTGDAKADLTVLANIIKTRIAVI